MRDACRFVWVAALLALIVAGCNATHTALGSESHFLERCLNDASCGPLSCIANRCTDACSDDSACTALAPASECVKSGTAASGVCGLDCRADADCSGTGAGVSCRAGWCGPAQGSATTPGTTTASSGQADAGTTRSASGTAGSSGPLDPATGAPLAIDDRLTASTIVAADPCGQGTGFPGDDLCLAPPAPELGIQIHIGPRNYTDPSELQAWRIEPGGETTDCWTFELPNAAAAEFSEWELAARPALHGALFALDQANHQVHVCEEHMHAAATLELPGALPGAIVVDPSLTGRQPVQADPALTLAAAAHAPAQAAVHSLNFTDAPLLRELWLNLYYAHATTPASAP